MSAKVAIDDDDEDDDDGTDDDNDCHFNADLRISHEYIDISWRKNARKYVDIIVWMWKPRY